MAVSDAGGGYTFWQVRMAYPEGPSFTCDLPTEQEQHLLQQQDRQRQRDQQDGPHEQEDEAHEQEDGAHEQEDGAHEQQQQLERKLEQLELKQQGERNAPAGPDDASELIHTTNCPNNQGGAAFPPTAAAGTGDADGDTQRGGWRKGRGGLGVPGSKARVLERLKVWRPTEPVSFSSLVIWLSLSLLVLKLRCCLLCPAPTLVSSAIETSATCFLPHFLPSLPRVSCPPAPPPGPRLDVRHSRCGSLPRVLHLRARAVRPPPAVPLVQPRGPAAAAGGRGPRHAPGPGAGRAQRIRGRARAGGGAGAVLAGRGGGGEGVPGGTSGQVGVLGIPG